MATESTPEESLTAPTAIAPASDTEERAPRAKPFVALADAFA